MNTRALAAKLIYEILSNGRSLSQALPKFKRQCRTSQDAALVQALAFGVIRWFPRLTFIMNQLLQKPLKAKDAELQYLIVVGLYQLIDMDISTHAAVSETVEAAKQMSKTWGAGLVNAILRSYLRQSQTILASIQNNDEAKFAHPAWLIESIKAAWPAEWEDILNQNNLHPPLMLRINLQKESRDTYIEQLKKVDLDAESIPFTLAGVYLKSPTDITKLPGFTEGLFSVQDAAAQLAAGLLELSPGLRVLDACAAPGGKTAHILETEANLDYVTAIDISAERSTLIAENLKRLHLKAQILTEDASMTSAWWDGRSFDRILLDAPCSATGVIRRHPDIKYLRQPDDIDQIIAQQLTLLQALWPLLKSGGILLYATCSILPRENLEVMETFVKGHIDATILPFSLPYGIAQPIGVQILPGQNNMDGFYYAKIQKSRAIPR